MNYELPESIQTFFTATIKIKDVYGKSAEEIKQTLREEIESLDTQVLDIQIQVLTREEYDKL